ncbi:gliding motility-associated C-terminal domain-containing protein [Bizionia echini]|uniref:Gliding motility-associated C-terminal domain-containing protein n=1 Tax=Bizionia echini TaxID=649333 RepID=A0A1I5AJ93_9FLAO|nr:gliding motility-associated C-terminal domain-containing protein [Bizionia echini]SFN62493.1 gliding motility-associated C-terminal domain-containing protein [Bizionia echini]
MNKTTFVKKSFFVLCFFVLISIQNTKAQIAIGVPNIGFTQACANDSFNTFNVTFSFSPESGLNPTNQFQVELSDATGSFATPTVVATSTAGAITTSPATLSFGLPTNTSGESYRIRIKSTAPVATSSGSSTFAAYYKIQDTPFSINNLIPVATYCAGGSYVLTIDNPGTGLNDSPLNYPSLNFKWYRATGPSTSVFVADGETLTVSQPGTYFVETDYGTCTSDSFSNRVTVSESTSGSTTAIVSSLGNPFCPAGGPTTLTTTEGNSYQWFLNGEAISGATNQTFNTTESGTFSVNIDLGSCSTTATIDLVSEGFTSDLNVNEVNTMEEGDTLYVEVTTSANNPEFQWYLNDILIPDATENTYDATDFGNYKVVINQTTGCIVSEELLFEIEAPEDLFPEVAKIPNMISPNGDGINDTWIIPNDYVSGTNTEVIIMDAYGKVSLKTTDYQNNWPENEINFNSVNPVFYYVITTTDNKTKKGSITIIK